MSVATTGRSLTLFLLGLVAASQAPAQMGDLPAASSLSGSFDCERAAIRLEVQQKGDTTLLQALAVDGRAADPATLSSARRAMAGLTRVTGMSARCGRSNANMVLLIEGHAGTPEARAVNRLEDDDVGLRLIFENGKLASATPFPLD